MPIPDPSAASGRWLPALRVRTPLQFFALVAFLVWVTSMTGLQRGDGRGLVAFAAGFFWMAVVTVLAYRLVRARGAVRRPPPGPDGG